MAGRSVRYLMWGFQTSFRASAADLARETFGLLDPALDPRVFLVGVLNEERDDRLPICVEPDDCGYRPELFADLPARTEALFTRPAAALAHPTEWHARDFERRRFAGCVTEAVRQVVEAHADRSAVVSFCAPAQEVEGFLVTVVLQLRRPAYERWVGLRRAGDGELRSLTDAAVHEYLAHAAGELSRPQPGRWLVRSRSAREIVRAAGEAFMRTPAAAGGDADGRHGLFEACTTIASLTYEGREGSGRLVLARPGHPCLAKAFALARPVPLTDYRAARKLLQLTSPDLALLCDSAKVYALGRVTGRCDAGAEDLFVVTFVWHHAWEVGHAGVPLMRVTYGEPRLPVPEFDEAWFAGHARRVLPGVGAKQLEHLGRLCRAAARAKHGALLVIAADAKREAERLAAQGIPIEPVRLDGPALEAMTAIDGAVLLDAEGTCHAIGVILDGVASPQQGTAARGARYNSAVRYVGGRPHCLAVVVSEDGMIDVLPELRPQVRRRDLEGALERLRRLAAAREVPGEELYRVMHWLDGHRFYLGSAACAEVNRLYAAARHRLKGELPLAFWEFVPNAEMNESYLLDG